MASRPVKKRKHRSEVYDDPFYIHPDDVPKGKAYQWVVTHVNGEPSPRFEEHAKSSGWKRVAGYKPKLGCVLMVAPKKVADAQRDAGIEAARKQLQEMRELFGMDADQYGRRHIGKILSDDFIVSSAYPTIQSDAPSIDLEVKVQFRLSPRFQDAAAAIGICPEEYAHRRMSLFIRGEIGGILFPVDGALELIESAPFHIQSKA